MYSHLDCLHELEYINNTRIVRDICDAAISLYSKYGDAGVSVTMIIDEADVAKGTFYKYFKDIYALNNYIFFNDVYFAAYHLSPVELLTELLPKVFTDKIEFYRAISHLEDYNGFANFLYTFFYDYYTTVLTTTIDGKEIPQEKKLSVRSYAITSTETFLAVLWDEPAYEGLTMKEVGLIISYQLPKNLMESFDSFKGFNVVGNLGK